MTQCLRCGDKLHTTGLSMHPHCIKHVFGASYIPEIELAFEDIPNPPQLEGTRFSLSNHQILVPMTFLRRRKILSRHGRKPTYTLKLPLPNMLTLPLNQNLCMTLADHLHLHLAQHTIACLPWGTHALLTQRTDRVLGKKLHLKSFKDILGRTHKHDASLEDIGLKLKRISDVPGMDIQWLFEIVLFSFIIGHHDLHLDKFHILYQDKKKGVRLAPIDDLASTHLLQPDLEELALPLGGKTTRLSAEDFQRFAEILGIPTKAYQRIILRFFSGKRFINRTISTSSLDHDDKMKLEDLVNERFSRLMAK